MRLASSHTAVRSDSSRPSGCTARADCVPAGPTVRTSPGSTLKDSVSAARNDRPLPIGAIRPPQYPADVADECDCGEPVGQGGHGHAPPLATTSPTHAINNRISVSTDAASRPR